MTAGCAVYLTRMLARRRRLANRAAAAAVLFYVRLALAGRFDGVLRGGQRAGAAVERAWEADGECIYFRLDVP